MSKKVYLLMVRIYVYLKDSNHVQHFKVINIEAQFTPLYIIYVMVIALLIVIQFNRNTIIDLYDK